MHRLLAAIIVLLVLVRTALAQSDPGLQAGQVPTAAQWNSYFSAKLDYRGYTPLNPDNLIGRLPIVVTPSINTISINCPMCGMPAIYGGTSNALVLIVTPAPTSLSTGDRFTFKVTSSNNAATTARINALPIYNVYKAGPGGASPLVEKELVPGTTVNLSFDATLNSGVGGWWLDGQASSTTVPANCAIYVPFNSPYQSGFTLAEGGGGTGGANIAPNSGGQQVACLTGNLEFKLDNFHITSVDPSGTTTDPNWVITGVASNGTGGSRISVVSTAGLVSGNKYGISSVYGSTFVNGYWTISNVTQPGTTFDIPVAYDSGRPWIQSPNFLPGFVSTGELDTQPYYSCNRIVLGRTPAFNDGICMHVATSQTLQSPTAAQGYGANNWWIVDPDQTAPHAQSLYTIATISTVAGARKAWPSFGVMRGVMTFAPDTGINDDRTCGGSINAHTQVGLLSCDKGFGTISANIAFFSNNQPIGQPPPNFSNGLRIVNTPGSPTTQIDIYYQSVALQGPFAAVGGNTSVFPQSTTVVDQTPLVLKQRINTATGGINGLRAADYPLAADTSYYIFMLKDYMDGSVGVFLTTVTDPATFPAGATATGYTSGYYALLGQIKTKPSLVGGVAQFDTFLIENGIAQHTVSASATMTSSFCSTQNYRTQILAGGGGNNTLTFGTATGFLSDCQMQVINTDAANTKVLAFGGAPANFTLVAGQAAIVQRVGAVFQVVPYAAGASAAGITALTTDVAATGPGSVAATIQPGVVTYAKIVNLGALSVMGRSVNTSGVGADIPAVAESGAVLREASNVIGFGTISTLGITNNAVTLAKLATQPANTVLANATGATAIPSAFGMPACGGLATCALQWTAGGGFVNNTAINAASLGGATFASPGAIGGTTAAAGTFTTLTTGDSGATCAWQAGGSNDLNCYGSGLRFYSNIGGINFRVAGPDTVLSIFSTDLISVVPATFPLLFVRGSTTVLANFQQASGVSAQVNVAADAANSYISFFKDVTPTAAWSVGLSAPGIALSSDVILASWNGTAWSERFRFSQAGGLSVGTTVDPGAGAIKTTSSVVTGTTTFGALPTCNGPNQAARHFITDATQTFTAGIGAAAVGGGANKVPVVCDGTVWRIGANDNVPQLRKVA